VVSGSSLNNAGHIYGNLGIDITTGDLVLSKGGMDGTGGDAHPKRLAWWRAGIATPAWSYAPQTQDIYSGPLVSHMNGVGFHPNLYGLNDGGIVVDSQFRTMFWRRSTDAIDQ